MQRGSGTSLELIHVDAMAGKKGLCTMTKLVVRGELYIKGTYIFAFLPKI
jgi:hypothetical protein